jgi:hypothetical protein
VQYAVHRLGRMTTAEPDREAPGVGAFNKSVEVIKAGFRDADAAMREQSYVSIEEVVVHERGAFKGAVASKFAAACVPALCREVLCAGDTKIDAEVRSPI